MKFTKYRNNRRLFDKQKHRYCTHDDIIEAVMHGDTVTVELASRSGRAREDVTRAVLFEVLRTVESTRDEPMLTVEKLHELIRG